MKQALAVWEQQMAEYRAAQKVAKTAEQQAALRLPEGGEIAKALWKAVNRKTGEREEKDRPSAEERAQGMKEKIKKIPTYEFEESWAAPAVVWFINHPAAFSEAFGQKSRQLSYFANALLESVDRVHYNSPAIAEACAKLAESSSGRIYGILEKIYVRNQSPAARANAAMAMCLLLGNPAVSSAEGSEAMARSKRVFYLRQALRLAPENAMFGSRSLSEVAIDVAYVLRFLTVESIPPQLKVTDKEGKTVFFPQEGKTCLIFFWSPDEEVGRKLVSKTHALMKQYPDLQFCPVTSHMDRDEWLAMLQENGIPVCYMDDEKGSGASAYRLAQLPTAVLTDPGCKIAFIGYPGLQLQTVLDQLTARQAENKQRVRVSIKEDEPVLQPGSQPAASPVPAGSDEAPILRDMPEF